MRGVPTAVCIASALLAGCSTVAGYPIVATSPTNSVGPCLAAQHRAGVYIGVTAPGFPPSTAGLTAFEHATGVRPGLISYYQRFGDSFNADAACYAVMHGALPLIQVDPGNVSLADITDGKYDYYMRSYATEVAEFRATVVLELGDELNGTWYRWGLADASARLYVAAWRHIVEIFRSEGASNVTWLWTINAIAGPRFASPRPWWPGGDYVNWVGIDGYYYLPSATFDSLIGPTIGVVRAFTYKPVLIAETGVSPTAGKAAKIPNLFAGVRAYGLLGFVWRDVKQDRDWRIETDSAAVAAFKRAVRGYQRKKGR